MNERLTQIKADIRFWWWKVRHVHAQRYISVITILAVLAGLTFFSFNGNQNKAYAANASWSGDTIELSGPEANYMLIKNDTADGVCLWPLNYWSAFNFNYNGVAGYRGKACTTTPQNLKVSAAGMATLKIVGDVTVGSLTISNQGIVTTAPSDIKGKATPYVSRSDYFTGKISGFIKLSAGITYQFRLSGSINDAAYFEIGRGDKPNLDDPGAFDMQVYTYGNNGVCLNDPSFLATTQCGKGLLSKAPWAVASITPGVEAYLPFKFSFSDITGDATAMVEYKAGAANWANLPVNITDGLIFPPYESGANVGKVDTSARGKARFEYGTAPLGTRSLMIDRDLTNAGSGYAFFSRVNITKDGEFRNFGKNPSTAFGQNLGFNFGNPSTTSAGNFLSNAERWDGYGHVWGIENNLQFNSTSTVTLLANYNLYYHIPYSVASANTGIDAGMKLTVSGDVNVTDRSFITVNGLGLPGGRASCDWDNCGWAEAGRSGIGGNGRTGSPGFYMHEMDASHGPFGDPGSNWANGMGGGGGASGKYSDAPKFGIGGGGGGVIGAGSGGFEATADSDGKFVSSTNSNYNFFGNGGGGLYGLGGAVGANDVTYAPNSPISSWNGLAGTSYLERYPSLNLDVLPLVMGGGGGSSGHKLVGNNLFSNIAGNGGGQVRLNIGGNLTLDNSYIDASGSNPNDNGDASGGGGGGGLVYIKLPATKAFNLNNGARIYNNGGVPRFMPFNGAYGVGGAGGGGLIKIMSGSYESNDDGWPKSADLCVPSGANRSSGHLYVNSGDALQNATTFAQSGIIDLRNATGEPFCDGNGGSNNSNIQISKQMQQWKGSGSGPTDRAAVIDDANWSDVLTVTAGKYIRAKISVVNLSSSAMTGVSVADKLPIDTMTLFGFSGGNVAILDKNGVFTSAVNGGNGASISVPNLTVPANSALLVVYATQVK